MTLPMSHEVVRSDKMRKLFLDTIEKGYSPAKAAKKAGETLRFFKKWREEDAYFAQDWDDAVETGIYDLEDCAVRRAKAGSDSLLTTLLKANNPEKYRERSSSEVKVDVKHGLDTIDHDLERKIAKALEALEGDPKLAAIAYTPTEAGGDV